MAINVWEKVLDMIIQDYVTKDVLARIKYASNVSIEDTYELTEIRGGSDNELLYTNYHTPKASLKASLPLVDDNVMVIKTGATTKSGVQMNAFEHVYTVGVGGAITLDVTPKAGTLKVNNYDANEVLGTPLAVAASAPTLEQYTISGTTLTCNAGKIGSMVLVVCDYMTGATAKGQIIVSGKLPSLIRIIAKTKVTDKGGNKVVKTVIIEKAKPDPSFTFETTAGTPSSLPFDCQVFGWVNEDGENQFYRFVEDPLLAV